MTIVRSITSQPTSCARLNCCEGEISWSMRITSTASCSRIRRSSSRLPVPKYAPDSNPARFCVNLPTTSNPSVFASWRNSVSDASNSTSLTLGNCTAATMARFGFGSISCIMVAEPISDRSLVDEKSTFDPARRRARRDAHGRVLAGPGSLEDNRRGGRYRVDLARRTLPLPRNLQGQNRLPLGRRGLSAGVALHDVADQAGADRMGPADVRNRRHQDAAHGTRLALRRRRTQSGTDPAARQSDTRHLRRPRLLRRLVPAGPGEPGPFLREERRRHLAAQPQPLVARNRRQPDPDHGDIAAEIDALPANSFDAILHDPPRFGTAGELYSQAFYDQLARVLKRNGKLFHYTGTPNKLTSGRNVPNEVAKRLQHAGFAAKLNGDGVLAVKK